MASSTYTNMKILITGGAGFIGGHLIRYLHENTSHQLLNIDKLTYAANLASLDELANSHRYAFRQMDLCDFAGISATIANVQPDAVLHLAAESHVDRSIDGPGDFVETNVMGTYSLLQAARKHYETLSSERQAAFRFLHVSTDEVYGSLDVGSPAFSEEHRYDPRSPYSATKAASDHLVRAWHHTYGLPVIVTNCSNNYGPWQYPEKLIPTVITRALAGKPIPVYGDGQNIRDWIFVSDHVSALSLVLDRGELGATYNIGGDCERTNIELVRQICALLDELAPRDRSYADQIAFVADRPGHDLRYAMNSHKMRSELDWKPQTSLETGLRQTVAWYLGRGESLMSGWGEEESGSKKK